MCSWCLLCFCTTRDTVLRLLRKLTDVHLYPTSLELLRVHLAATIFSDDVQSLLERYKDQVSLALNIRDLDPLLIYLSHFWELLQLNNSVTTYVVFIMFIIKYHLHITGGGYHMVRHHWSWWCGDSYWGIQSQVDQQTIWCEYCSFGRNHRIEQGWYHTKRCQNPF